MNATVDWVEDEVTQLPAKGTYPPSHIVKGGFSDGTTWSIFCDVDKSSARKDEMRALVGKTGEFEVKKTSEFKGVQQHMLSSWPGKASSGGGGWKGGGGGGNRPFTPTYSQSKEAHDGTQVSIHASVALEWGAKLTIAGDGPKIPTAVIANANLFFAWLRERAPAPVAAPETKPIANDDAKPASGPSQCFNDFKVWLATQVSGDPNDKRKAWARVMSIARSAGYSDNTLQACNDGKVFANIMFEFSGKGDDSIPF